MSIDLKKDIKLVKIKRIIGVLSGKGGVGKSLVAGLLATGLQQAGENAAIFDADLTGPSIPKMFGLNGRPGVTDAGITPVKTKGGIGVISLNLMLESSESPVIWRGPMLSNAITQLWNDADWDGVESLVVDLPPGTADIPLTVMQSIPLTGFVIVSSPQELAAMIVKKTLAMAKMLNIKVFGLVENMTYLTCPKCGEKINPFGVQAAESNSFDIPLLASLPIDPQISALCDEGRIEDYRENPFFDKELLTNILKS